MESVKIGDHSNGVGRADFDTTGSVDFNVADNLAVTQDIVIVEPEREEKTASGILIADVGEAQKVRWGKVLNAGPGKYLESGTFLPNPYKPGYRVMFGRYQAAGEPLRVGGKEMLLFRMGDLIGWDTRA